MKAAELRERVIFSKRSDTGDDYGNPTAGDFVDQFTVWARIQFLRGGEGVIAERLAGKQPTVITVRRDANTASVRTEWRAVDANDPTKIYNIRAVTPDEKKRHIDFLCETGVTV